MDRRSFVKTVGATGALGLAGCLHGDDNDDEETAQPGYVSWLYNPEEAGQELDQHTLSYTAPSAVPSAAREGDEFSQIRPDEFDAFDAFISVGGLDGAFIFDYAAQPVFAAELADRGIEDDTESEERAGFEIYDLGEEKYGVNHDAMVVIGSANDGVVEAIVDTHAGDAPNYADTVEDFDAAVRRLGEAHVVDVGDEGFAEDATAGGRAETANEDGTVDVLAVDVFPDEGDVNTEDSEEVLRREGVEVDEVVREGRLAVGTGTHNDGILI